MKAKRRQHKLSIIHLPSFPNTSQNKLINHILTNRQDTFELFCNFFKINFSKNSQSYPVVNLVWDYPGLFNVSENLVRLTLSFVDFKMCLSFSGNEDQKPRMYCGSRPGNGFGSFSSNSCPQSTSTTTNVRKQQLKYIKLNIKQPTISTLYTRLMPAN